MAKPKKNQPVPVEEWVIDFPADVADQPDRAPLYATDDGRVLSMNEIWREKGSPFARPDRRGPDSATLGDDGKKPS